MTSVWAVVLRECRRMVGRPIYLVMTLVLPLFCYLFFASMLGEGLPQKLPIAVVDLDGSSLSCAIVRMVGASAQTDVGVECGSMMEAQIRMRQGGIYGTLLLPRNMQRDAMAGRRPTVVFATPNNFLISGSLAMRDLTQICATASSGLNISSRAGRGASPTQIAAEVQPIRLDFHAPGNPTSNYSLYLSTILSHALLQILILLTTVFVVGIEAKNGTSKQWMETAGGSMVRALAGKLLPYTVLFSMMATAGNTLFFKYLDFPIEGSFVSLAAACILVVAAYQAMAVFILGLLSDMRVALTVVGVYGVLGISFSGLTFPIEIMDAPLQGFSLMFPIRHYFHIYIDVAMHGLPVLGAWGEYVVLLAFSLTPLVVLHRLKRFLS